MYSQEGIIKSLHDNKCPLCGRAHMVAEVVPSIQEIGITTYRRYVSCDFCLNKWEISKETFDDHVRICDTRSYKLTEERKSCGMPY